MNLYIIQWIFVAIQIGSITALSCTCGNIEEGLTVTCDCTTQNDSEWLYNNNIISLCISGLTCSPVTNGNGATLSITASGYRISVPNFNMQSCHQYTCRDTATKDQTNLPYCPVLTMTKPTTNNISIEVNTPREFICTLKSSPAGTIEWYRHSGTGNDYTGDVGITTGVTSTTSGPDSNQEYTVTSNLRLSPDRTYHGNRIYCKAVKQGQTPLISERKPQLNILYYSSAPSIEQGSPYSVIEGTTGQLTCSVTDGNPIPTLRWNCNGGSQTGTSINGETRTRTVTWNADRSHINNCVCTSSQTGLDDQNASATINVLYPPSQPTFRINEQTISGDIKIIENNQKTITCQSTGNPAPTLTWQKPSGSSGTMTGASLTFSSIRKTDFGSYSCEAKNTMTPTGASVQQPSISKSTRIVVLFPPSVARLQDVSLLKGKSLQVTCNVTRGYPISTTTRWTKDGTIKSNNEQLSISSVQKTDVGRYTCTSSNTMSPSGDTQTQGTDSKQFVLTVLYAASVTSFDIEGHNGQTTVTVDENSPVPFECSADSVPTAKTSIKYGGQILHEATSNALNYSLPHASCQDAGSYVCAATNEHNENQPTKTIKLFVNCKPRSADIVNENQTSEKGSTHTFTFNAIAYPEPSFVWKKRSDTSNTWNTLQNGHDILITTTGLQSNLTIGSVTQSDFTKYLVQVKNNFGQEEYQYNLAPFEKPDAPTEFQHIAGQATESSIQLKWTPGSNGGPPQTFYIQYKKSSSQTWNFVSVPDDGEQTMSYKLTGLEKGAEYHLIIYSSNVKGNSSESEILIAHTQGGGELSNIGPLIGGAVGGAACLAIIVLLVVFFLRRYKSGKGQKGSDTELNRRSVSDESDDEMTENPAYVTSGAVAASASDNTYSQVQKKPKASNISGDIYAVVNKPKGKDKKKNQKDKSSANANVAGDVYENVQPQNGQQNTENTYGNVGAKDSAKQPKKKNVNQDGLIYVELDFDKQQKGKKPTIIIGDDDRTPYADVDFTKRADPLPDSDEDNP